MESPKHRYAVGIWKSLEPNLPYLLFFFKLSKMFTELSFWSLQLFFLEAGSWKDHCLPIIVSLWCTKVWFSKFQLKGKKMLEQNILIVSLYVRKPASHIWCFFPDCCLFSFPWGDMKQDIHLNRWVLPLNYLTAKSMRSFCCHERKECAGSIPSPPPSPVRSGQEESLLLAASKPEGVEVEDAKEKPGF